MARTPQEESHESLTAKINCQTASLVYIQSYVESGVSAVTSSSKLIHLVEVISDLIITQKVLELSETAYGLLRSSVTSLLHILTSSAVPCPVPRLTTFVTSIGGCSPFSKLNRWVRMRTRWCGAIFCPMSFHATFETGRSSSYAIAFVAWIIHAVVNLGSTCWRTSYYNIIIAPLEEAAWTSLRSKKRHKAVKLWQVSKTEVERNLHHPKDFKLTRMVLHYPKNPWTRKF